MTSKAYTADKWILPLKERRKIAIIEPSTSNHNSLVENWLLICNRTGVSSTIFSNQSLALEVSNEISASQIDTNPISFAKRLMNEEVDTIIFTTLQTNFIYWAIFFIIHRTPKYITIHNANYWLAPSIHSRFGSLKNIVKYLSRCIILRNSQGVVFCSEEQIEYVRTLPGVSKTISWVPFMLCDGVLQKHMATEAISGKLRITLPGVVTEERKRYDIFLDALEADNDLFELVFLGRFLDGEVSGEVLHRIVQLREAGASIVTFSDYVPSEVFSEYINKSHFLAADFIPILTSGEYAGETYGLTKETGVIGNMVRFRKPTLLRRGFPASSKTVGSIVYFDTAEDLRSILQEFADNPDKYEELVRKLNLAVGNFSLESVLAAHEFD